MGQQRPLAPISLAPMTLCLLLHPWDRGQEGHARTRCVSIDDPGTYMVVSKHLWTDGFIINFATQFPYRLLRLSSRSLGVPEIR